MKRLVEEVEDDGFSPLMGEKVTLLCMNYFYTGKLVAVNKEFVELEGPEIVYETGAWDKPNYQDAQKLPTTKLRVRVAAIEAYGKLK